MPFSPGLLSVTEVDNDAINWKLNAPLTYVGRDHTFIVGQDFETDFATVPRVFVWLIPRYGIYTKAAIVHDFLCQTAPVSRADADGIFRRMLRELGVPVIRRWMMWAGVRVGGHLSGMTRRTLPLWVAVALPSIVFLLVPSVVLVAFLAIFWIAEEVAYVAARLFSHAHEFNQPKLLPLRPPLPRS